MKHLLSILSLFFLNTADLKKKKSYYFMYMESRMTSLRELASPDEVSYALKRGSWGLGQPIPTSLPLSLASPLPACGLSDQIVWITEV